MMDHHSKRSRGFGFVSFANEASVEHVLRMDSRPILYGKPVEVKRAVPRDQLAPEPLAHRRRIGGVYPPGMQPQSYGYAYGAALPLPPPYGAYPAPAPPPPQPPAAEHDLQPLMQHLEQMRPRQPASGHNWQFAAPLSDSTVPDTWPENRGVSPARLSGHLPPAPQPGSHDSLGSATRAPILPARRPHSAQLSSSAGVRPVSAENYARMDMLAAALRPNSGPSESDHGLGPLDSLAASLGSVLPSDRDYANW